MEDGWICKLQTRKPTGLNSDYGAYAREVYTVAPGVDFTSKMKTL